MQLCLFCLSPLLCRWKGGHALWTPLCHSLADAGVFMCECAEGAKESEVAVQSADCTKTLLTSPAAAAAAAAEVAASLVLARLMAEWAPPCPAVPLLPPQWRACWNWAGWHYRAQPDHTVKRDYAINRHAHKQHAAAEKKKDPLPARIKTGKQLCAFPSPEIKGKNDLLKQSSPLPPSCKWIGIIVRAY